MGDISEYYMFQAWSIPPEEREREDIKAFLEEEKILISTKVLEIYQLYLTDKFIWNTSEGQSLKLEDMTIQHVKNVIALLERKQHSSILRDALITIFTHHLKTRT